MQIYITIYSETFFFGPDPLSWQVPFLKAWFDACRSGSHSASKTVARARTVRVSRHSHLGGEHVCQVEELGVLWEHCATEGIPNWEIDFKSTLSVASMACTWFHMASQFQALSAHAVGCSALVKEIVGLLAWIL